ncbi:hypothetical protein B0H17DRAFT_1210099 [Mycena rosella]|uniref:Uncharacterized protein n=1 Tax=Mycena rosella TaxID=1033263 RepID=A0AAD7CXI6_MYCRO|nr:hypothetical protein B0H17DRAFT_1210099 [Mycena rosella]
MCAQDASDLHLLATLASAAPSIPATAVLDSRDDFVISLPQASKSFTGYSSDNTYNYVHNNQNSEYDYGDGSFDFSPYDMGYMPLYSMNSASGHPSSSPSKPTGYKRPPSPTPLLGNSPKRAHLSTGYDDINWTPPPVPTLSTAQALPSLGKNRVPKLALLAPATLTAPFLQNAPRSPVLIQTKAELVVNKGNWSVNELSTFYEYTLGQDADAIFQNITMSSNKCWKQFAGQVGIAWDAKQMKTQWDTSLAIYKKLVPLLKFTGGGADADEEPDWEDKDAINNFLKSQATGGHDVEGLSAKKVKQWLTSGWFNLFDSRYGENPKAVREIPRSSADTLSDVEGGLPADDNNKNDSDVNIVEKPSIPATPAPFATMSTNKGIATDPREVKLSTWDRSKPASRATPVKVKKEDRLQGLNNYLEGRVRVDEQAMMLAKADAEFKRLKATEATAKEIAADTTGMYTEETKVKARRVLEKLMDAALDF